MSDEALADSRVPKITFITHEGVSRTLAAPLGGSLMYLAVSHGIAEVEGACGGSCACATCHVRVDAAFQPVLPPMSAGEDLMLNNVATSRTPMSRLACQIPITASLDGLIVHLPEYQS